MEPDHHFILFAEEASLIEDKFEKQTKVYHQHDLSVLNR